MTTRDRNASLTLWVLLLGGACLVSLVVFVLGFELDGLANLADRLWGPK